MKGYKYITNKVYSFYVKNFRRIQSLIDAILWKPGQKMELNTLLDSFTKKGQVFFIQVGANDGISGDKLYDHIVRDKWHGILVEPVPYIYDRLVKNYEGISGLVLENCAIGDRNGYLSFYSIAEINDKGIKHSNVLSGHGLDQLGSFDKKTVLKHRGMIEDFESYIKEINVRTVTFNELCSVHSVTHIDLLQVDTEGYDYEILISADLSATRPEVLIFENRHMSRDNYKNLITKLKGYNYTFYINGWDTIACINK